VTESPCIRKAVALISAVTPKILIFSHNFSVLTDEFRELRASGVLRSAGW